MFLEYTDEQRALRKELREYFAGLLTPEVRAEIGHPGEGNAKARAVIRRMGVDGWLGLGWPTEFGGQGRGAIDQFILFDEVQRAGAPFPFVTINTVGPTLMKFGSEEHKRHYLPGILSGDINFAIGYTEPEAGTDLASLRTRAVLDGDEWVINGNKVFTSGANQADYIWLACRTDPDAPKHKGISIIIVPTDSPGFKTTPIVTVGSVVTQATYYDDMVEWCRATDAGDGTGRTMAEVPWVQTDLARAHALLEAMKLLNWRMAAAVANNTLTATDASASKVFGVETQIEAYRIFLGILGAVGYLPDGSPGAVLRGAVEQAGRSAQINTFGGGVVEVLREMIAAAGLSMVRQAR